METNLANVGRTEELEGDYEQKLAEILQSF